MVTRPDEPGTSVHVDHECDAQPCTAPVEVIASDPLHEHYLGACTRTRHEVAWSL